MPVDAVAVSTVRVGEGSTGVDKQTGLEREAMVIKGVRSELRLEGGRIHIVKEATTQARPTSVEVDVRTVRGSTLEVPRRGGRGWYHIATVNGSPAPVGELAASGDPYALPITKGAVGNCKKLQKLIDRHVKERGLPADVGPNQGRFTSGVVVSGARKPVTAPMVTVPEPAAAPEPADEPVVHVEAPASAAAAEEESAAPRKRATKKAVAKKPAQKKPAPKTAAQKKPAQKKPAQKKPAQKKPTQGKAAAATELVSQLRELGELHAAGVLDDAEFAAAKKKLLA